MSMSINSTLSGSSFSIAAIWRREKTLRVRAIGRP